MSIDSTCTGCGKTLRVNDEFVGRKARCPVCATVYLVSPPNTDVPDGSIPNGSPEPSDSSHAETTYAPNAAFDAPQSTPARDSWTSFPTAHPIEHTPDHPSQLQSPLVDPNPTTPIAAPIAMYFVRTPNLMVYGPSSAEVVHEWIREGRLDDTCHVRQETSDQWLGIPAWRFQIRTQHNPMANPAITTNQFGSIPVSSAQSVGYSNSGNGSTVLVLGLISWLLCFTFLGGIICAILAIVFGMTELKKIRQGQSPSKDKGIVLIGLWLGIANLATWCLGIFFIIVAAILSP